MADDTTQKFAPRLIEFVAAGIFGVGVHRCVYSEYAAGLILIVMGALLFAFGHFWDRLTRNTSDRFKETAIKFSQDFRVWFVIVLLFAGYFAVFPLPVQQLKPNSDNILTWDNGRLEGMPLGVDFASAGFLSGGIQNPKITEFNLPARNIGSEMVALHDAYIISNVTGQKIIGTVNTVPFPEYNVSDTAPIPMNAWLSFHFKFAGGLSEAQLIENWRTFAVNISYDSKSIPPYPDREESIYHAFSADDVARMEAAIYSNVAPHVTKKQP